MLIVSSANSFVLPRQYHGQKFSAAVRNLILFAEKEENEKSKKEFIVPPEDQLVSDTPPEERGIGVGIDLGTTNSCASLLKNGVPYIVTIPNNGRTMPSVVSFDENNNCVTGEDAVKNEIFYPSSTYRNVKRIMGMGGASAAISAEVVPNLLVKSMAARRKGRSMSKKKSDMSAQPSLKTQLKEAEESPALLSCNQHKIEYSSLDDNNDDSQTPISFSPEEISSKVLSTLFQTVEEQKGTGEKITRAVVGVPAYFNDKQREATLRACELAGVKKARLLREPEAAALAYGIGKEQA